MSSAELIPNPEKHKLELSATTDPDDESCMTFVMHHEDHTLGNSLRYIIMKNPDVEYCGYNVPHPSEEKINFRVQTKKSKSATEVVNNGLLDLQKVSLHVLDTFQEAVMKFKEHRKGNQDVEMESGDEE